MSNYKKINVGDASRTELHDALGLTGCEVSINEMPADGAVPFVHRHALPRPALFHPHDFRLLTLPGDLRLST